MIVITGSAVVISELKCFYTEDNYDNVRGSSVSISVKKCENINTMNLQPSSSSAFSASEVVLTEVEDPYQNESTSFDGPPPAKRLRLVGSGSTHVSAVTDANQAASDPILEELFGEK